jgi:hypothetical protein
VEANKHGVHFSLVMTSQLKNLIYLSSPDVATMYGQRNQPEGEALLRWKATLLNSNSLSSWSHAKPTSYWDGVTCDEGAGYVTHLDLSYSSLHGRLDAFSFSMFQHLAMLDLINNNLFGAIPTNISLLVTQSHRPAFELQKSC